MIRLFHGDNIASSRQYVLFPSLCWLCVNSGIWKWLKQTHYVICFTKIFWGYCTIKPVTNHTLCVSQFTVLIWDTFVHWKVTLAHHFFLSYFTKIHFCCFVIWNFHRAEIIWYVSYCVDCVEVLAWTLLKVDTLCYLSH